MIITKKQGAMISLGIISFYTFLYYLFVKNNTVWFYLTVFFFIGALAHFVRENRYGAELRFFGAPTGVYWDAGYCLVPSIFHILHNINIYLLWDLDEPESENTNIRIDTYHDQRQSQYQVRANVSLFWLNIDKFISFIFGWLSGVQKGKEKLLYQRIGFRIILVTIVVGWICNSFAPKPVNTGTSTVKQFTKDGKEITPVLYKQAGSNVPVYLPFQKQCVVVDSNEGAVIIMTMRMTSWDYSLSETLLLLREDPHPRWEEVRWGHVTSAISGREGIFSKREVLGIPKSNTTTEQKKVCF